MPFNSSTAILYYNRTIFKKAGLDPTKPPTTYEQIEKAAKACVASGATKIGFTTAWPSWTLVENAHAWHDQPFSDMDNGFKGMPTRLRINGDFGVKMWTMLARWQKEGIYTYSGRTSKGDQPIVNGEAAIGLASTALVGTLTRTAKFDWGTGNLPRMAGYPQGNSIIGGATLWVMKGKKAEEYKGVAAFLEFLDEARAAGLVARGDGLSPREQIGAGRPPEDGSLPAKPRYVDRLQSDHERQDDRQQPGNPHGKLLRGPRQHRGRVGKRRRGEEDP